MRSYHLRGGGVAMRDAVSKEVLYYASTEWLPARERCADGTEIDRVLSAAILERHIAGRYSVAWEQPSWSSLIVLDIDRPTVVYGANEAPDPMRELEADRARDGVLAQVWEAFGFDEERRPILLRTPGAGYHVYIPLCRMTGSIEHQWPAHVLREHIERHLLRHGLAIQPGTLEVWPSGNRLRAPCGVGMALLEAANANHADDLQLELVHASLRGRRTVRDVAPMVEAFCDAVDARRRPLHDWLGTESLWDDRWGPWGTGSRHNVDSRGGVGPKVRPPLSGETCSSDSILNPSGRAGLDTGRAFRDRISALLTAGLVSSGTRHDAVLKLTWHWGVVCRLDRAAVLAKLESWLTGFEHVSMTYRTSPARFLRRSLREAEQYFDRHVVPCVRARGEGGYGVNVANVNRAPLSEAERGVLATVDERVRGEAEALLGHLSACANADGRVLDPVTLSETVLAKICGEGRLSREAAEGRRRRYVVAVEELCRLGVLGLYCDYSTGKHGRIYNCWHRFGHAPAPAVAPPAPAVAPPALRGLVLASRLVAEGELQVTALAPNKVPQVVLNGAVAEVGSEAWWVRMYARRSFSVAEFFAAEERTLLPGRWQQRWPQRSAPVPAAERERSAQSAPLPSQSSVPPSVREVVSRQSPGLQAALLSAWAALEQRDLQERHDVTDGIRR